MISTKLKRLEPSGKRADIIEVKGHIILCAYTRNALKNEKNYCGIIKRKSMRLITNMRL